MRRKRFVSGRVINPVKSCLSFLVYLGRVGDHDVYVKVAAVPPSVLGLLSKPALRETGAVLHLNNMTLPLKSISPPEQPFALGGDGRPRNLALMLLSRILDRARCLGTFRSWRQRAARY